MTSEETQQEISAYDNDKLAMEIFSLKNHLSNEIDALKDTLAEERQEIREMKNAQNKDKDLILELQKTISNYNAKGDEELKNKKYWKLKASLTRDRSCPPDIVLLRSDVPSRDYTLEELENVRRRPFASRLYISGISIDENTVWLQTHFSDCHAKRASLRRIRDLVKAMIITQNHVASFNNMSDVLIQLFEMKESNYCSLAATLASAISNYGKGVNFERRANDNRQYSYKVLEFKKEELLRKQFTRLMHILFSKVAIERHLVKEERHNIFRLAYCLTKYLGYDAEKKNYYREIFKLTRKMFWAYLKAFVSFFIQVLMTLFIILSIINSSKEEGKFVHLNMIPLTIATFVLSSLLSWPQLTDAANTFNFYNGVRRYESKRELHFIHPLVLMDYAANMVLPVILTIAGSFLILIQDNYTDAVLNSTALLFIIDIDDNMPKVLNLDVGSIIRNHLITEALIELQEDQKYIEKENLTTEDVSNSESLRKEEERLQKKHRIPKIQFADMMLTNHSEGGTDTTDSLIYAPHAVMGDLQRPKVIASNFISSDCLFRRIEWSYTTGLPFTSNPRIAIIKLWKLDVNNDEQPYVMRMPSSYELSVTGKNSKDTSSFLFNSPPDDEPRENHSDPCSTVLITDPHEPLFDPYSMKMKGLIQKCKKINDDDVNSIKEELRVLNPVYRLEGVYMITTIECSESISRLRICGSNSAGNFISAIESYSLWELHRSAERKLKSYQRKQQQDQQQHCSEKQNDCDIDCTVIGEEAQ